MKPCALILVLGALLLTTACGGSDGGTTAVPEAVFTASDGATATFPPAVDAAGAATPGGSFQKILEATGEVVEDQKNVSATYELRLDDAADLAGNVHVSIPLASALVPTGVDGASLQPMMDDGSGTWRPTGSLVFHDAAEGSLTFAVNLRGRVQYPPPSYDDAATEALSGALVGPLVTRFRVDTWLWTSAQRSNSATSSFRITWYPPELGKTYSAPGDAAWGNPSGTSTDPAVPNFVEDLDAALNLSYGALLGAQGPTGPLFTALGLPQDAAVGPCGWNADGAGESPLGGPLKISNTQIKDLHDLIGVAAHELVHVFQGQHYTSGVAGKVVNLAFSGNRWFLEASANWLAAEVLGYTDDEKAAYWTKDGDAEYLSTGLATPDDNQMYTAAHFLEYLADLYGRDVVGRVMTSSGAAVVGLSRTLLDLGVTGGLSGAFRAYGLWLLTHPEDTAGMNRTIVGRLAGYTAKYLPNPLMKVGRTYLELSRPMAPLSMSFVELRFRNQAAGKIVAVLTKEKGAPVESVTFGFVAGDNASFVGQAPLEVPGVDSVAVGDCGQGQACTGLLRLLIGTDFVGTTQITESFHLLLPPDGLDVQEGLVTWSEASIGTIPARLIGGYHVYRQAGDAWEKLGDAPYTPGGRQSYSNASIRAGDLLLVQVEDAFGNAWPEVEEASTMDVWLSCRGVQVEQMVWGCVRYTGVELDLASTAFLDNATARCLDAGYEQYYALAFDDEQECRDWCSQSAGDGETCATPGEDDPGPTHPACQGVDAGDDACYENSCYNCCGDCEGGAVLIYECMGGCTTTSDGPGGATLCDCL